MSIKIIQCNLTMTLAQTKQALNKFKVIATNLLLLANHLFHLHDLCGVREKHTTDSLIWGCRTNIAFIDMGSQCMVEYK